MPELPPALRVALDDAAARVPGAELAATTARLIQRYQGGQPADAPILATRTDAVAYAVYRMPATYAAARSALGELARQAPDWRPSRHVDIGGGTGAAVWAAAETWAGPMEHRVVELVPVVADLGRSLAAEGPAGVRSAVWEVGDVATAGPADLVTACYVLGELAPPARAALVARLVAAGTVLVVVEPGTVAGYRRVLAVRDAAIDAGQHVVAPCPHSFECPMANTRDWCHVAARVNRTAAHRRAKGAALGYEDEKFAYVVVAQQPVAPAPSRVVRHPQIRKGLVELTLCTTAPGIERRMVSRRRGSTYRAARNVRWGDPWSPAGT